MTVAGGFCARGGRRRLRRWSAAIASTESQADISRYAPGELRPRAYRGYAGIDLVGGDLPRVVDANPRRISFVGIAKVMRGGAG
ncbi:hypothetical protein [Candidatus Methanocrinis natronophilus]|uniref:Uncharacterized protein n=1 Tax=Candidatus Methanocrinis natronophilus TaxID=3033396 RepID=A0ABT5X7B9_9EURY|nr:hypothetical protein [Candidatus Methanocrinis natronophilus]MDF0590599.1 hypothetical protein [Candidatus Methanocrinis natronophilus]